MHLVFDVKRNHYVSLIGSLFPSIPPFPSSPLPSSLSPLSVSLSLFFFPALKDTTYNKQSLGVNEIWNYRSSKLSAQRMDSAVQKC